MSIQGVMRAYRGSREHTGGHVQGLCALTGSNSLIPIMFIQLLWSTSAVSSGPSLLSALVHLCCQLWSTSAVSSGPPLLSALVHLCCQLWSTSAVSSGPSLLSALVHLCCQLWSTSEHLYMRPTESPYM